MKILRYFVFAIAALASISSLQSADKAKPGVDRGDAQSIITEQRLKRMTQDLTLTEDQRTKIRPLIVQDMKKMAAIRDDQTISTPTEKRAKMAASREEFNKQVIAVLTPEQKAKFEASLEAAKKPAPRKAPKESKPAESK